MNPLRQQMIAVLHLSGKSERTQASYVREVRRLAPFYHNSPDRLSAQELPRYCLHRQNVDGLAPASMRLCSSGLRCFSPHVLQRDWSTLALLRAHTTPHLPAVLRVEEGRRLLAAATTCHHPVSCTTVSRVGLRLPAALVLQVSALDGRSSPFFPVKSLSGRGTSPGVPFPRDQVRRHEGLVEPKRLTQGANLVLFKLTKLLLAPSLTHTNQHSKDQFE